MKYRISHTTSYQYAETVSLCHNLLHLQPRACPRQVSLREAITVSPEPGPMRAERDYFGNPILVFAILNPHRQLEVRAQLELEVMAAPALTANSSISWETVRNRLSSSPELETVQYLYDSPYIHRGDDLAEYALPSFPPGRPLLEAALELTARIQREFKYDPAATSLATPLRQVLQKRRGVCQDFAHLQIGCLRSLGLAARYVSGYIRTTPPAGQPRLVGADASHAWVSVYCAEHGWLDLDPTNNVIPSEKHITLAWGRDYDDVSPIKGVILGGGPHVMTVAVEVVPLE